MSGAVAQSAPGVGWQQAARLRSRSTMPPDPLLPAGPATPSGRQARGSNPPPFSSLPACPPSSRSLLSRRRRRPLPPPRRPPRRPPCAHPPTQAQAPTSESLASWLSREEPKECQEGVRFTWPVDASRVICTGGWGGGVRGAATRGHSARDRRDGIVPGRRRRRCCRRGRRAGGAPGAAPHLHCLVGGHCGCGATRHVQPGLLQLSQPLLGGAGEANADPDQPTRDACTRGRGREGGGTRQQGEAYL